MQRRPLRCTEGPCVAVFEFALQGVWQHVNPKQIATEVGLSFYHANNPDQAIVYCLRAVQLDPRLLEARLWVARSYLRQGEKAHARTELNLLARNPAAKPLAAQIKQLRIECAAEPANKDKPSKEKP